MSDLAFLPYPPPTVYMENRDPQLREVIEQARNLNPDVTMLIREDVLADQLEIRFQREVDAIRFWLRVDWERCAEAVRDQYIALPEVMYNYHTVTYLVVQFRHDPAYGNLPGQKE